jgi:sulfonate transport system ATP-binding protein
MGNALIRFADVAKTFVSSHRTVHAVQNVNLEVSRGELVTLVGPSGCGKSTLLNMTAGLFQPSSGSVFYDGTKVTGYNLKTGYITQNDHLLPWRDVAGNVAVPLEIKGTPRSQIKSRIEELVALVGLAGFEKSYPSQLSGGMRKRTALARLLAYDPETLLMDEPFAALDAQTRDRLIADLAKIAGEQNTTFLFVTHDVREAVRLADRILVFSPRPGRIIETVAVTLPRPRDAYDPELLEIDRLLRSLIGKTEERTT